MTVPTYEPRSRNRRKTNNVTRNRTVALSTTAMGVAMALFLVLVLVLALTFSGRQKTSMGKTTISPASPVSLVDTIRLRSGLEMPAVGYGTCCRPSAKGEAIFKSTKIFLKNGGRLIDTAMAYRNHEEIGKAIAKSGIPRSEIWITSKIAPNKAKNYDECLIDVDNILEELETPYLDLLLIHAPKLGKERTTQLWKCLIEARHVGKVKSIGVSNFNRGEIEDIAEATNGEMPEANEIQQHPWSSQEWRDLARWQKKQGIATIAYTSLGGSRFHRAEGDGAAWPGKVTRVAKAHGVTEAQVLLKWALQHDMAVIPGSGSKEHILENLMVPSFQLSEEEILDIESADAPRDWWDSKRGPIKYGDEEATRPWEERKNG